MFQSSIVFTLRSTMSKPSTTPPYKVTDDLVFYTFGGSMWCHAPSLALIECGVKKGDVEEKQVNLVEGANFDPNGFLKVNPKATVPAMEIDGKRYTSTVEVVEQILKFAPDAPKKDTHTDHELRKIIHGVHAESHDPNAMLVLPVDDDDLEAKAKGLAGGFIAGRQKALDQYVTAPGDFKTFIEEKHKANGGLQKLYTDSDVGASPSSSDLPRPSSASHSTRLQLLSGSQLANSFVASSRTSSRRRPASSSVVPTVPARLTVSPLLR